MPGLVPARRIPSSPAALAGMLALCLATPAHADLAAANGRGVAMGQLHYYVADLAAESAFWSKLGGQRAGVDGGVVLALPGVLIVLNEVRVLAEAGGESLAAAIVDHVAFRVRSLSAIESGGLALEMIEAFPGIASVYSPAGVRVELFEEGTATNVGFESDYADAISDRHNLPLVGAIDSHHLHFYLPEDQVEVARDWYVRYFGAVPGRRWRYLAADLPGMNLNFSAATEPRAPTRGGTLDHLGFEVDDLERLCRELMESGIVFEEAYQRVSEAFAVAVLTDPWGVTIELSEGLRGF